VTPLVTVAMPAYNREDVLRRALRSLEHQTMDDFLCIVVDDASTVPLAPVVDEFDSRFRCVRSEPNRGCTGTRYVAYEQMEGDFLMNLDSDNEFFPWTLERALFHLSSHHDIDGVAGMSVFEDGLRVIVADGSLRVTPDHYATHDWPVWDCHAMVRRGVVEEWTAKRQDYYNYDFHFWLTFHLAHNALFVDEPWGRHNTSGGDRISDSVDPRRFRDPVVFVEEHRPLLGDAPCRPLDAWLMDAWFFLRRNGRSSELAVVRHWMDERGVSTTGIAARRAKLKIRSAVGAAVAARTSRPAVL
jgi:glycosyltransferase involved in cell wall biosynthesis